MMIITQTGTILKGRYCLVEALGFGSSGHVYLARDLELGTLWAVKELPISEKREAGLLKNLQHPCIPRMIDYVESGPFCYLVMEYIQGWSLRSCLQNKVLFSKKQVLKIGLQAAQVLEYLHHLSPPVYYCDLKPENLMLSENGNLFLVDFGSACRIYTDQKNRVYGTPGYAAPEQYTGCLKPNSDVYSLGKILRELWGHATLRQIFASPLLFLFLLRCSRFSPQKRYSDITAARSVLENLYTNDYAGRLLGILVLLFSVLISGFCFSFF